MKNRIAYITYEYPPDIYAGGIATYVYEAARMMQEAGWDVEVFAGSFTRTEISVEDGIIINRVRIRDAADFMEKVVPFFMERHREKPFDIYETPEINGNGLRIAEMFPSIPFVTKLHTPLVLQTNLMGYYRPISQKLRYVAGALRRGRFDLGYWRKPGANKKADIDYRVTIKATAVSSPSVAMKNWAVRHWNIPVNKIGLLPNIYSPSDKLLKQEYSPDRRLLTFIGKINMQKGMWMLMKALPGILENCPEINICLIGGDWKGPDVKGSMRELMEKNLGKWKDRINFTGNISQEEIHKYLFQSVACIFPSIWEAFGYVALEAMSAGVPVIVSRGSGFEEIVCSGRYGITVDPFSADDIALQTIHLLQDKKRLKLLSIQARAHVLEAYSRKALQKRHEDFT